MDISQYAGFDEHEALHKVHDASTGLEAIVAVHSTTLGPAAGGCRRWVYDSEEAAITDALRLSRGMTLKNAMAGLPFGGGKAIIMSKADQPKTAKEFEAFGEFVNSLRGQYVTAEDVGVTTDDMLSARTRTRFVSGLPPKQNAIGGDPSPWTALGVYVCMKEAAEIRFGSRSLSGLRVAIQGVGNVGYNLCRLLANDGATLFVSDISATKLRRAVDEFGAVALCPEQILAADVDILSPCALGAVFGPSTTERVRAEIIAGAANNQLAADSDGVHLKDLGKLYLPDYVINSGGIVAVAREYLGGFSQSELESEIQRIPARLRKVLQTAFLDDKPPHRVADDIARSIIRKAAAVDARGPRTGT